MIRIQTLIIGLNLIFNNNNICHNYNFTYIAIIIIIILFYNDVLLFNYINIVNYLYYFVNSIWPLIFLFIKLFLSINFLLKLDY